MAVISVAELFDERSGELTTGLAQSIRTYQRTFLVKTDDKNDDVVPVRNANGIPRIGDRYPSDAGANGSWARTIAVRQLAGATAWTVTVSYSSEFEILTNPLDDPAIITWSAEQFQRPTYMDRYRRPILNSAFRFFSKLPQVDDSRFVVSVQKNVAVVPAWVANYQDALNIAAFTVDGITVGAELAKFNAFKIGTWQERNAVRYRVLSFDLHLSAVGWDLEILDEGKSRLGNPTPGPRDVGSTSEDPDKSYAAVNDGDQTNADEDVLLNGWGQQLPKGNLGVFLPYGYYPLKDFTVLPLT